MSSTSVTHRTMSTPPPKANTNDPAPLRHPVLDSSAHALIAVAVLIPILFIILLCSITYCAYRYKKKRAERNAFNSSMTPIDQHNIAVSTLSYNPVIKEGLPPSYDLISETKKDRQFTPEHSNINDQVHLSTTKTDYTPTATYSNYFKPTKL